MSTDDSPPLSWTVEPGVLVELRLKRAREALEAGEPDRALVEAEELLDQSPDQIDALRLAGESALALGDAALAADIWEEVVQRQPEEGAARLGLSQARFGLVDFIGAEEALRPALELAPQDATAWLHLGLIRERQGDLEGARAAWARSIELDPDSPARWSTLPLQRWRQLLEQARELLPPPVRDFCARVPIRFDELPPPDELRAHEPPLSPYTEALAVGQRPSEGDPWEQPPEAIRLYTTNLGRPAGEPEELAERVAWALLAEVIEWLGIEDPSQLQGGEE